MTTEAITVVPNRKDIDINEFKGLVDQGLNRKQIAKHLNIHEKPFGKLFRDLIGIYPSVYIKRYKNGDNMEDIERNEDALRKGAPRTESGSPEEMIELGKEMVDWVKKHSPLHLSQWYSIEKEFTQKQWDTISRCQDFFPYYERAMRIIGIKYLDKGSNVRDNISNRWQAIYFGDLRKHEKEVKEEEAEIARNDKKEEFNGRLADALDGLLKKDK